MGEHVTPVGVDYVFDQGQPQPFYASAQRIRYLR